MKILLIVLSLVLLTLGVITARRNLRSVYGCILTAFIVSFVSMLSGFYMVSDYFTGVGVDESVIYHLRYGLGGAGFGEYPGIIAVSVLFIAISLFFGFLAFKSLMAARSKTLLRHVIGATFLLLSSVAIHPASEDIAKIYLSTEIYTSETKIDEVPEGYIIPEIKNSGSAKNLIFIYLESLEQTYFDETIFPDLVPGLKSLKEEALHFDGIEQLWATGWTIAGMTASQCGIPLSTRAGVNTMSGMDSFLPGAVCIGDVLKSEGYDLEYMGGAYLDFAGKGNLYKTHGFGTVQGREELSPHVDERYMNSWGLYDDSLFDQALRRLESLEKQENPFGLFLLTLDTHHPKGHPSASCEGRFYADGENEILNAVHCSDFLVTRFVNQIRSSSVGKNTIIVLASDHLARQNTASDMLAKGDRKNLFLVLHPDQKQAGTVQRRGSTLDIGPTLLSLMGFDVSAVGFGRDLRRDAKTLVEQHKNPNQALRKPKTFYSSLWEFPQLDKGIYIDAKQKRIFLSKRKIKYPALLSLDKDMNVTDINFEFSSPENLANIVAATPMASSLVWVDRCHKLEAVRGEQLLEKGKDTCIGIGTLGGEWHIGSVRDVDYFSRQRIAGIVDTPLFDQKVFNEQNARIKSVANYDAWNPRTVRVTSDSELAGDLFVVSVGGSGNGPSLLTTQDNGKNDRVIAKRGLTLVGIRGDSTPVKLAHTDTCKPGKSLTDSGDTRGGFADIINTLSDSFGAYVVIGHDSANCKRSSTNERFFNGLPFEQWRELQSRQPYIGVIAGNGQVYEALGENEQRLFMHLSGFVAKEKEITHQEQKKQASLKPIVHTPAN